jgi:RNA polymerase sigma-70 factor (ECF subfamily)
MFLIFSPVKGDQALLALAQQGQSDAYDQLIRKYREGLLHWLGTRFTLSIDLLEDAIQEATLEIQRKLPQLAITSSFKAYLYATASHRCLDIIRRGKSHPQVSLDGEDSVLEFSGTASFESAVIASVDIETAFAQLTPYQQTIVKLSVIDGWLGKEIAALVKKPAYQICRDLQRALAQLRTCLERR